MAESPKNPLHVNQGNEDVIDYPLDFLIHFLEQIKSQSLSVSIPDSMATLINHSVELASGLQTYPVEMSTQISEDAKLLAQTIKETDFAKLHEEGKTGNFKFFKEMSSDILQGSTLKMFARMASAKNILEIGTFMGFAALNLAEALPSDGRLVSMESLPHIAELARDLLSKTEQRNKIEVQTGRATELLNVMGERNQQFDFIFIDAAKNEYKEYISIILDKNILAPKGTVLFDNTIFKGATYMPDFPHALFAKRSASVRAFNEFLMNEPRVEQVMLPISDGVTIVRRVGE